MDDGEDENYFYNEPTGRAITTEWITFTLGSQMPQLKPFIFLHVLQFSKRSGSQPMIRSKPSDIAYMSYNNSIHVVFKEAINRQGWHFA